MHITIYWCHYFFHYLDQYEDQFEKRSKEREERIAKNEYQRLRNLARDKKGKVKGKRTVYLQCLIYFYLVPIPPTNKNWNKEQVCVVYYCSHEYRETAIY